MECVTLVFEPAEEGGYSAYVAEVPGVNSQGETLEEAKRMVSEALVEMLAYRREKARAKATSGTVYEQIALA
jgi:predicted RNase H-like HicB family nuclease